MATRRFELEVTPPFRLDLTPWALRRRPHNAIDRFDGSYRRVLEIRGRVRILLRRVLGLDLELADFYRLPRRDKGLSALPLRFRGMRPPRFPSLFECLVNAIACQQLSLTVGIHLLNRLAAHYGPGAGRPGELAGFPSAQRLATTRLEGLRALGFSGAKARAIKGLAGQVTSSGLNLDDLEHLEDDKVRAALLAIPGVGRWSAEYVMLRGLGRLQVLPGDDVGARNILSRRYGLAPSAGYDEVSVLAREWWPYGGLVYFHLLLDALTRAGHLVLPQRGARHDPVQAEAASRPRSSRGRQLKGTTGRVGR
jgi:DNA-3-methyladenine glycosylase II